MRIMLHTEQFNQIMTMGKNIIRANENREAMRGVHIVCNESGECRAEVCNGYTGGTYKFTVAAHAEGYEAGECLIPLQPVRKVNARENPLMCLECDGKNATVTDWHGATTFPTINAEYLDMQRVYPTSEPVQTVYLNPAYLAEVLKACKVAGGSMVKMEIRAGLAPVRITNGMHNMLVLPVRHPGNDW